MLQDNNAAVEWPKGGDRGPPNPTPVSRETDELTSSGSLFAPIRLQV